MIAIKSMMPNKNAHRVFCSHGISYGRLGEGLKHSVIKSLNIQNNRRIEINSSHIHMYVLVDINKSRVILT